MPSLWCKLDLITLVLLCLKERAGAVSPSATPSLLFFSCFNLILWTLDQAWKSGVAAKIKMNPMDLKPDVPLPQHPGAPGEQCFNAVCRGCQWIGANFPHRSWWSVLWPASAFLRHEGRTRSSEAISPVMANFDTCGCGGFESSSMLSMIKEGVCVSLQIETHHSHNRCFTPVQDLASQKAAAGCIGCCCLHWWLPEQVPLLAAEWRKCVSSSCYLVRSFY